jgi:hypothetical protein
VDERILAEDDVETLHRRRAVGPGGDAEEARARLESALCCAHARLTDQVACDVDTGDRRSIVVRRDSEGGAARAAADVEHCGAPQVETFE